MKARKYSRDEYLKKRVQKKLKELKDEIVDEPFLFEGVKKLTQLEQHEFKTKKQIYEISKNMFEEEHDNNNNDYYKVPYGYDDERGLNHEKIFSHGPKFESKDMKHECDEFVFENQIDFVKAMIMDGENLEQDQTRIQESKSDLEKQLQEDRKTLPIYQYRDALLQAVSDHQVLVIVGETGSGKTTQIPQYLHEAGYTKRGKIGCTQPRRVAAMSVATRVSKELGVKLGPMKPGPDLANYECEDEYESFYRLLISSATLDAEKFSDFFDSAPIFKIPGRRYPVIIQGTEAGAGCSNSHSTSDPCYPTSRRWPISKASANQRAGRSGRTGPGKCFRLYTAYNYYQDLEDNSVPEIQLTNLANVVLTLMSL
ncbi:hypothetical protein Leryth_020457 [Lithospermum erythrorhizon]|nr:hypothetical protein Leryth_020457 [Lithospermum erythrorhizon]